MKLPVKKDDIIRFGEIYHTWIRRNLSSELDYPKELKDLTTIDISVINIVASNPDIIVKEIAESLKIPNSTLTSSLNRLEDKGIAKRVISTRDRRSFSIELTHKGRNVQQAHLDFEKALFEAILARLDTHEERKVLLDLMRKIADECQSDENNIKQG